MKVRTLLLATAIAVCMSPAAWAAQVDKAGGAMRQGPAKAPDPDKLSDQERRAMEADLGEKPDAQSLPYHQATTRWRWHYRNTTSPPPKKKAGAVLQFDKLSGQERRAAEVELGDKPDPAALPHHQLNTRWRWHYRNTSTSRPKPDKK